VVTKLHRNGDAPNERRVILPDQNHGRVIPSKRAPVGSASGLGLEIVFVRRAWENAPAGMDLAPPREEVTMQPRAKRSDGSRARTVSRTSPPGKNFWSRRVMNTSDALDLEHGIFQERSPRRIASSLKRSAERSRRRKSSPFRSAMSMLNFYINRAGRKLSAQRKEVLERAKVELRNLFGKE
jgi:hypothetical protein